jgi:uncharacterized protein (DUF2147 family)
MKFKWRNVLFILAMFLVVILLMDFSRRIDRMDRLETQLETVQAKATAVMGTQVGLMTQVAYATSDAAVEEWAYVDGKWVKQGQHLVEIVPEGEPPAATETTSAPKPDEQPKWRIWWVLFFGD